MFDVVRRFAACASAVALGLAVALVCTPAAFAASKAVATGFDGRSTEAPADYPLAGATARRTDVSPSSQRVAPVAQAPAKQLESVNVQAWPLPPVADFKRAQVSGTATGPQVTADSASLVRRIPGAALNDNGPLAGQIQYRGLYGVRQNILVDGMHINPGGPNWMDTPLHYMPRTLLDTMSLRRGIAPVADGIETLGVTVQAISRQTRFGDSAAWQMHGTGMLDYHSVNHGYSVGGILGGASDRQRFDVVASRDHAGDASYRDGTIRDTAFRRSQVGADYGVRWGRSELGLHARYDATDGAGNPVFPLDTEFMHTAIARAEYLRHLDDGQVNARVYYIHVAHAMNNVDRRPTPDFNPLMPGPDARRVPASARDWGLDLWRTRSLWGGELSTGINAYLARNSATVTDPDMPAFRIRIFNRAERNLYSAYAQWQGDISERARLTTGTRFTRVNMDTGPGAVPMMLPMPAQHLTETFNAASRARHDNNVDAMARLDYRLDDTRSVQFGLARKTRSPSYLERYGYIPLETTAGLADGNNYVGDIGLKPEVAYQADLGLDWQGDSLLLAPRVFLTHIVNYIQGLPIDPASSQHDADTVKVSGLNGDPTPLRFSNVQAQLYGADLGWLAQLGDRWQLDGSVSYTRGLQAGGHDNLYRIAPLHGDVRLAWAAQHWRFEISETFAAAQKRISRANTDARLADPATPGYALLGLAAQWKSGRGLDVRLGVSNLFGRNYYDALSGYNRVMHSDVPLGGHMPGRGRDVYVQLVQHF